MDTINVKEIIGGTQSEDSVVAKIYVMLDWRKE